MIRFYDTEGKTYFYTYNADELRDVRNQPDRYKEEGRGFYILNSPIPGEPTVSLKRFRTKNGSKITYFYTTNRTEGNNFGQYQGIVGYVLRRAKAGAIPLYRLRNS